jgi:hypothetical protein
MFLQSEEMGGERERDTVELSQTQQNCSFLLPFLSTAKQKTIPKTPSFLLFNKRNLGTKIIHMFECCNRIMEFIIVLFSAPLSAPH